MASSRRIQARDIVQRRILALIPRATADTTTVTVERRYTMLGQPAMDSWTGDIAGFTNRIALALYGVGEQDGPDDLQTPLREQLGAALIAAGAVPATMPVEILAQAGALADAVLPIAAQQRRAGFRAAIEVMRQEKLPMSVELLEAQLELDRLDSPDTVTQGDEEEDTPTVSTTPSAGATSTARAEILRALQAYGHSDASALVVLRRADCENTEVS